MVELDGMTGDGATGAWKAADGVVEGVEPGDEVGTQLGLADGIAEGEQVGGDGACNGPGWEGYDE